MFQKLFTLLIISVFASIASSQLSCLDRQGNPVAWFTFIEYPGNVTNGDARYAYLDNNLGSKFKVIEGANCDDKGESLARTVDAINAISNDDKNLLAFSNIPPNLPENSTGAHAKAFVAYDNKTNTGVYVLHSFLVYPEISEDGKINVTVPKTGSDDAESNDIYGDFAYCISIDQEILTHILSNLPLEQPDTYYATGLFANLTTNSTEDLKITEFNLLNKDRQWLITKNPNYNASFYENVVAHYFDVPLAVQSFGHPYQDSSCPPGPTVVNVETVQITTQDKWDIWADNSKWAVSINGIRPNIVCLCDMDRTDEQSTRGGSCFCSNNIALYEAYSSIAVSVGQCPKDTFYEIDAY